MLVVPALVDGRDAEMRFQDDAVSIAEAGSVKRIPYADIKGAHVKNEELYLLKLSTGSGAVILQFPAIGVRDLAKALVMNAIVLYEGVRKRAMESDVDARVFHASLKRAGMKELAERAADTAGTSAAIYAQRTATDIYAKDFLGALTQPIVDAFIAMNCSLHQFYNIFTSTYFYDIANAKCPLDRLLAEKTRLKMHSGRDFAGKASEPLGAGGARDDAALDYATRINSYSMMALGSADARPGEAREAKKKEATFVPQNPFVQEHETEPPAREALPIDEIFRREALGCSFEPPRVLGEVAFPAFDPKDFELARDICRAVCHTSDKAVIKSALEFSKSFKEMLLGQYGGDVLKYVERLMPSFYVSRLKNKP
ncbi:hypothetical protein PAPHI01_0792 [Pancytospora philotis]|nr:hypothetical protein PAPHI01_0792 [Pancytospora philotis]